MLFCGQVLFLCFPGQVRHRQSPRQAWAMSLRPFSPLMAVLVCQPGEHFTAFLDSSFLSSLPFFCCFSCPSLPHCSFQATQTPSVSHRVASVSPGAPSWQVACSPSTRSISLSWECTTQDWMSGEGRIWRFHSRWVTVTQLPPCQPGWVVGLGQGLPRDSSISSGT